ncbi:MAG: type VI secretion system tip protein VgrG [Deltaproteobacteria bacterium]|jgi:type VI secretion system secreted protein VgrG|nr:type VI secretion system tip protein VgrG [Deltaproteobacteria bacterium]
MSKPEISFDFSFNQAPFDKLTPHVAYFKGSGGLNRPFSFNVTLLLTNQEVEDLDAEQLMGAPATLTITDNRRAAAAISGQENRPLSYQVNWRGQVMALEIGEQVRERSFVEVQLTSILAPLGALTQNRIHLDLNTIEIVENSLLLGGIEAKNYDFGQINHNNYPKRDFVFQYDEDLLAFILRSLEREGLGLWHDQSGEEEVLRLADKPSDYPAIIAENGQELVLQRTALSGLTPDDSINPVYQFRAKTKIPPKNLLLKDYNWLKPSLPLEIPLEVAATGQGEVYLFGENFDNEDEGYRLANIRKEEFLAAAAVYSGLCRLPGLLPGHVFELQNDAVSRFNGRFLVVAFESEGRQAGAPANFPELNPNNEAPFYRHNFSCQKADQTFRPQRVTPRKKISGSITAWIDGAGSGEKPELDSYGRYKVLLPLDVSGRGGGKASAWIRQAQPSVGAGYGQSFPLYPGVEVVLSFIDGNPDRPIISAALTNGETGPNVNSDLAEAATITTKSGAGMVFLNTLNSNTISLSAGVRGTGLFFTAGLAEDPEEQRKKEEAQAKKDQSQDKAISAQKAKNKSQDKAIADLNAENEDQDEAISGLSAENQDQDAAINGLAAKNADQDAAISDQATKNAEQDKGLSDLQAQNTAQDTEISDLKTSDADQDASITDIKAQDEEQDDKIATLEKQMKNTVTAAVFNADTIEQNASFNKIISVYDGSALSGNKFEIKASPKELGSLIQLAKVARESLTTANTIANNIKKTREVQNASTVSPLVLDVLDKSLPYADDGLKAAKLADKSWKFFKDLTKVKSLTYDPMVSIEVNSDGESVGLWQASDSKWTQNIIKVYADLSLLTNSANSSDKGVIDSFEADDARKNDKSKLIPKISRAVADFSGALAQFITLITTLKAFKHKERRGITINNSKNYVNVKSAEHLALSAKGPILLESLTSGRQVDLASAPNSFDKLDKNLLKPEIFTDSCFNKYNPYQNFKAILMRTIFQRTLATEINQQAHGALFNKAGRLIQLTTGNSAQDKFKPKRDAFRKKYWLKANIISDKKTKPGEILDSHAECQDPQLLTYSKDFLHGVLLETREENQHIQLRTIEETGSISLWQTTKGEKFSAYKPAESRNLTLNKDGIFLMDAKSRGLQFLEKEVSVSFAENTFIKMADKSLQILCEKDNVFALSASEATVKHGKAVKITAGTEMALKGKKVEINGSSGVKIDGSIINLG